MATNKKTQEDPFMPGIYNVTAAVCYGSCGSDHSHSAILGQKTVSFELKP
jgi:hypothetical protein